MLRQFVKLIPFDKSEKILNGYIQEGFQILTMTSIDVGILVVLQGEKVFSNERQDSDFVDGHNFLVGGKQSWKY